MPLRMIEVLVRWWLFPKATVSLGGCSAACRRSAHSSSESILGYYFLLQDEAGRVKLAISVHNGQCFVENSFVSIFWGEYGLSLGHIRSLILHLRWQCADLIGCIWRRWCVHQPGEQD